MTDSTREVLKRRIRAAIQSPPSRPLSEADFEALALDLFAYQYERNPVYGAYCSRRDMHPSGATRWRDIPAVPTDAFKAATLFCGDPMEATLIFETSGTTQGDESRGRHFFRDSDLYRAALQTSFMEHVLPSGEPMKYVALVPQADQAPHSSLSFMISDVVAEFSRNSTFAVGGEGIAWDTLSATLRAAVSSAEPLVLLGTSFSFVHLLDLMDELGVRIALPPGSRAMDTGGFKGKSREIPRAELYGRIEEALGIPAPFILNEYGMTEMSSQFYDGVAGSAPAVAERVHMAPGWVRSAAADPATLRLLPDGEWGILRHVDLANLDSVAVLQTSDWGRVVGAGQIELTGRAPGAEPRGCSIAMDMLLHRDGEVSSPNE